MRVADTSTPALFHETTVSITVNEVNEPPALAPLAPQEIVQGDVLRFQVAATDSETSQLRFSVAAGPEGASIDAATGEFSWSSAAPGNFPITIRVTDDAPFSLFAEQQFVVNVLPVNVAPTLAPIAGPLVVLEDALPQTLELSGISAGAGQTQNLTLSARSSNPALVPDPLITFLPGNNTASLSFRPAADRSGTAVITVTIQDDGGTANGGVDVVTQTFTVNVTAVNDRPTFTGGADQTATDSMEWVALAGWASAIWAGSDDEANQELTFTLLVDSPGLFAITPAIDRQTGDLTFAPAPNAHGSTMVTVTLEDNGGSSDGGQNTSTAYTFQITIDKPMVWHNTQWPLDVTGSGGSGTDNRVVASDALAIINYINAYGQGPVPTTPPAGQSQIGPPYYDTVGSNGFYTGDNFITAADALAVINWINAFGTGTSGPSRDAGEAGEGEVEREAAAQAVDALFEDADYSDWQGAVAERAEGTAPRAAQLADLMALLLTGSEDDVLRRLADRKRGR